MGTAEEPQETAGEPQVSRLGAAGRGSKTAAQKIVPSGRSSVRMGPTIREGIEIARTEATVDRVYPGRAAWDG